MGDKAVLWLAGIAAAASFGSGVADAVFSFNPDNSYSAGFIPGVVPNVTPVTPVTPVVNIDLKAPLQILKAPLQMTVMRIGTASANTFALAVMVIVLGLFYGVVWKQQTNKSKLHAMHAFVWLSLLASAAGMWCNWMLAFPATEDLNELSAELPSTVAAGSINLVLGTAAFAAFLGALYKH